MSTPDIELKLGSAQHLPRHVLLRIIFGFILTLFVLVLWVNWRASLSTFAHLAAGLYIAFSGLRLCASLTPISPDTLNPVSDINLPNYTVLVPLFHEANMAHQLITALARIDYPEDKLEIFLICEAVDPETIAAVRRHIRPPFKLIIVPKGKPQTKPRALNYTLQFSEGDLVTIYDAEDLPHPQQLRKAAAAFTAHPDWAALQAPLDYHNDQSNWLTRQFALEYAALFHVWVPFLARLGLPFPLGGTSNHIRRTALEQTQGWDAYNVTEDADLSFRLAAHGGKIGYISLPTDEEAVQTLPEWNLQRSRWIKGYMQSWSVHMAAPFLPGGILGFLRFLTLQITLGFTLLSVWFYVPSVVFTASILAILYLQGLPIDIAPLYLFSVGISAFAGILIGAVGAWRAGKPRLIVHALFMPAYWLLHFTPALRAAREIRRRPFYWHKTRHGIKARPNPAQAGNSNREPAFHDVVP